METKGEGRGEGGGLGKSLLLFSFLFPFDARCPIRYEGDPYIVNVELETPPDRKI